MNLLPGILYMDDALLVVDKPAGLLSLPDGYQPNKPHLRRVLEPEYGRLWMVHRLDKDTPFLDIYRRLVVESIHPKPYGETECLTPFIANQLRMQLKKRLP